MIDAHDDEIGAAEAGRLILVAEPTRATGMGGGKPITIPPGAWCTIVRRAVRGKLDIHVRQGGGLYRLRVERDQWCNLDLEPGGP